MYVTKLIKDKLAAKHIANIGGQLGNAQPNDESVPSVRESIMLKNDDRSSKKK